MRQKFVVVPLALGLSIACSGSDEGGEENNLTEGGGGTWTGAGSFTGAGGGSTGAGGSSTPGAGGAAPTSCDNDGALDPGEQCDGADLGGRSCATETMGTMPNGVLTCSGCRVVASGCTGTPGAGGTLGGTGGSGNVAGSSNVAGSANTGGMPQGAGGAQGGEGETGRMVGMTAAHNAIRQTVSPGNPLPPLTWSPSIAATAQAYADQLATRGCPMVHSNAPGLGENLAWFSGSPGSAGTSVNLWASEVSCYTFGTFMQGDSCSSACDASGGCGHYTQIVWRNTTQVGCGMASCGATEIWVCNYSPPGNYIGQTPY